jgi:SAM-dependent methyltransferase
LNLAKTGFALDFGCGNGVWGAVIKKALPNWKVFGTDISSQAISNAKRRFPHLNFFELTDERQFYGKFDFLFSHHVLEHVFDMNVTFNTIDKFLKPSASMLHILPCGNAGSFENRLGILTKDGIDKQTGRLFYEDLGHIRRLDTRQMNILAAKHGFTLSTAFYSHHYWAAIQGITAGTPQFILKITNCKRAKDEESQVELKKLRNDLLRINILRLPTMSFERLKQTRQRHYTMPSKIMDLFLASFLLFSYSTNSSITLKAEKEWDLCKSKENGGEMYLYYSR